MEEEIKKEETNNQFDTSVPTKISVWSRIKSFLLQEINFGFSPKQQANFKAISNFWHQEITDEQAHDFLFQKMKF